MTTAAANSTTTGTLPANALLRVLGDSIVTITRDGAFVASQSTARDNFVGPYPVDSTYSVVVGDAAIDISLKDESGTGEALVPLIPSRDANNNVIGQYDPVTWETIPFPNTGASSAPYILSTWGDSRANTGSGTTPYVEGNATLKTWTRSPSWFEGFLGDADIRYNFGYSGGTAANWDILTASDRGTQGKTYLALASLNVDLVQMQFGVNDALALTPAATIIGYLQANILEILKQGKRILFESIYPVNVGAVNYAAAQVIIDAVNAAMEPWIVTLPQYAIRYADVSTQLKDANGYFNASLTADGTHPNQAGAYLIGKASAAVARNMLAKRTAMYYGPDNRASNLLDLQNPTTPQNKVFQATASGTFAAVTPVYGIDAYGSYEEFTLTATALTSGAAGIRLEHSVNFNTANLPYYSLAGNEYIQGQARVVMDDGAGGAPAANGLGVRQRFYTLAQYADWGQATVAASTDANFTEAISIHAMTPRLLNTVASASASPSSGAGYQMQVFVTLTAINTPVRVRLYNPCLRVIGNHTTPLTAAAFALPASAAAYTNNSLGNQQVSIGGGMVSAIAINGTATGLTSGTFILSPLDTITPTYTVAPTWVVKQI